MPSHFTEGKAEPHNGKQPAYLPVWCFLVETTLAVHWKLVRDLNPNEQ